MFLDFYNLKEQPFGVTPDPRFLYLGRSHREALASLYCSIEAERGFAALIAYPGMGKTTLAFQLLERLQLASRTVFLFQTQCNGREFFRYLLNGLGVESQGMELVAMHNRLNQILSREMLAGRRFILAVDEAQNLEPEVLEAIRLLSNFETSRSKMLQILLIGQPQLARKLDSPELEQLRQRISVFARIAPFGPEETAGYIAHRLRVAGYAGAPLFSPGALRLIAEHSQGVPRKINGLCFGALSLGCAMDRKQVDAGMVEEVVGDTRIDSPQPPRMTRPVPSRASTLAAERPPLSSYPTAPKRSFTSWILGIAGAACIAVGIGMLALTLGRSDGSTQSPAGISNVWGAGRVSAPTAPEAKTGTSPGASSMNVQAAELPHAGSRPGSPSSEDTEIDSVIVQPGERLRQVILRTIGVYDEGSIEAIRNLNPDIADLNHLQPGQVVRFPRDYAPVPGPVGEGGSAVDKNGTVSHPE
jgi:type II secretory pathway predicted ATPase ExeA